jgi:archaellum component FlaC
MGGCHINTVSKRKDKTVLRYTYPAYECKRHRSFRKCDNGGAIREVHIEEYLLKNVKEQFGSYIADFEAKSKKTVDNRQKKNQLKKKFNRLKVLYLNEAITLEEYKNDREELEIQLNKLSDTKQPAESPEAYINMINKDFESMYQHLDNQQKRLFWRSVIKEIRLSKRSRCHREYTIIFL